MYTYGKDFQHTPHCHTNALPHLRAVRRRVVDEEEAIPLSPLHQVPYFPPLLLPSLSQLDSESWETKAQQGAIDTARRTSIKIVYIIGSFRAL